MKKSILILMLALTSMSFSQKIEKHKTLFKYEFIQNGYSLSFGDVVSALSNNKEAYNLAKSAKNSYTLSQIIGTAGGFLIGWPLGTALGGGKPNWTLAGIGAGLVVVSIPIEISSDKKINKALEIYNAEFSETSMRNFKPSYRFIANNNGIGIAMNF